MTTTETSHVFLTQGEVASRWRISERTLEGWRNSGRGPQPTKIGSRVRYAATEVSAYEKAHGLGRYGRG